jgi:hypothetical protein
MIAHVRNFLGMQWLVQKITSIFQGDFEHFYSPLAGQHCIWFSVDNPWPQKENPPTNSPTWQLSKTITIKNGSHKNGEFCGTANGLLPLIKLFRKLFKWIKALRRIACVGRSMEHFIRFGTTSSIPTMQA